MAPLDCITIAYLQKVAQEVHQEVVVWMLFQPEVACEVVRETVQ